MKEHPILFSTQMVRAILAGQKNVTRRVCKDQISAKLAYGDKELENYFIHSCPYGKPGDTLWVRETWTNGVTKKIIYKADYHPTAANDLRWKPSIHIKRTNARIFLQVVNISFEPLKNITDEDAIKEGVLFNEPKMNKHRPTTLFFSLWEYINGKKHHWDSNPFVWRIEFSIKEIKH